MSSIETCRCDRFPQTQCERLITQEDLLCDQCRERCARLTFLMDGGGTFEASHIKMPGFPGVITRGNA